MSRGFCRKRLTQLEPLFLPSAKGTIPVDQDHPVWQILAHFVKNGCTYSNEILGGIPLFLGEERLATLRLNQKKVFINLPWLTLNLAMSHYGSVGTWFPSRTRVSLLPGPLFNEKIVQALLADFNAFLRAGKPVFRLIQSLPTEQLPNLNLLELEVSQIFRGPNFDIQLVATRTHYEVILEGTIWQLAKTKHVTRDFVQKRLQYAFIKPNALEARNYLNTEFKSFGRMV